MVEVRTLDKGVITVNSTSADIPQFYKNVKEYIEELDYDFAEKEQAHEKNQYGGRVFLKFEGTKKITEFTKKTMKAEIRFENIKNGKSDVKITYQFGVELDYKNRWDKTNIQRFLYKIYINYFARDKIEKEIIVPIILEALNFKKYIKAELKLYNK